jgi:hypothetical protein
VSGGGKWCGERRQAVRRTAASGAANAGERCDERQQSAQRTPASVGERRIV